MNRFLVHFALLIHRHYFYYMRISHYPILWAIEIWIRIHLLRCPVDLCYRIIDRAVMLSSEHNSVILDDPFREVV